MGFQKNNFSSMEMRYIVGQKSRGISNSVYLSGFCIIAQKIQKKDMGCSSGGSKSYTYTITNHKSKAVLLFRNAYQVINTLSCNVFSQPL